MVTSGNGFRLKQVSVTVLLNVWRALINYVGIRQITVFELGLKPYNIDYTAKDNKYIFH